MATSRKEYQVKYRQENKEKVANWAKKFQCRWRTQLKKFENGGRIFDISLEEFITLVTMNCHYCHGVLNQTGSSLDRKDNNKDYLWDNVVPSCGACNMIKGANLTYYEMLVVSEALIAFRKLNIK